jgi:hypothetical protein
MAFTAGEIAGFIGAAAWLPQMAYWGVRYFSKPNVIVIPDKTPEVGYSTFGPIINLRLAISTDNKEVLLNNFEVLLVHEDGEQHTLTWQGTTETFSQIRDQSGASQVVEKQETGIAVKVKKDLLTDKTFRFQENRFHESIKPILSDANKHQNFLMSKKMDYHQELFESEKVHDLIKAYKSQFWWKPGMYTIKFSANCLNESMNFDDTSYNFQLTQQDVEDLKVNIGLFDDYIEWHIKNGEPGFTNQQPFFRWVYPKIGKK